MKGFAIDAAIVASVCFLVLFAGSPASAACVSIVSTDSASTPTVVVVEKPSVAKAIGRALIAPFRRNVLLAFPVDVALGPTRVYVRPYESRGGVDSGASDGSVDRDRPITLSPQITIGCPGGSCQPPQDPVWKRVLVGIAWTALPSIALVWLAAALRRRITDRGDGTTPPANDPPAVS